MAWFTPGGFVAHVVTLNVQLWHATNKHRLKLVVLRCKRTNSMHIHCQKTKISFTGSQQARTKQIWGMHVLVSQTTYNRSTRSQKKPYARWMPALAYCTIWNSKSLLVRALRCNDNQHVVWKEFKGTKTRAKKTQSCFLSVGRCKTARRYGNCEGSPSKLMLLYLRRPNIVLFVLNCKRSWSAWVALKLYSRDNSTAKCAWVQNTLPTKCGCVFENFHV